MIAFNEIVVLLTIDDALTMCNKNVGCERKHFTAFSCRFELFSFFIYVVKTGKIEAQLTDNNLQKIHPTQFAQNVNGGKKPTNKRTRTMQRDDPCKQHGHHDNRSGRTLSTEVLSHPQMPQDECLDRSDNTPDERGLRVPKMSIRCWLASKSVWRKEARHVLSQWKTP